MPYAVEATRLRKVFRRREKEAGLKARASCTGLGRRKRSRPGALARTFQGWMRVLLFTAIPAGFISHIPVELLRSFDPALFGGLLGIAALSAGLAVLVFHVGVRRYESGNLVVLRG